MPNLSNDLCSLGENLSTFSNVIAELSEGNQFLKLSNHLLEFFTLALEEGVPVVNNFGCVSGIKLGHALKCCNSFSGEIFYNIQCRPMSKFFYSYLDSTHAFKYGRNWFHTQWAHSLQGVYIFFVSVKFPSTILKYDGKLFGF